MARRAPADYLVDDPVDVEYGYDERGGAYTEPEEPIPGWRKPIALVGWGLLIAILIGLIIWGIMQLVQGAPPQEPPTITTTPGTTTPPPSSAAPVAPPTQRRTPEETTTAPAADIPTASTEDTSTPTTTVAPSPGAFPLPQLPSVITLPAVPGLPTAITLPPGL